MHTHTPARTQPSIMASMCVPNSIHFVYDCVDSVCFLFVALLLWPCPSTNTLTINFTDGTILYTSTLLYTHTRLMGWHDVVCNCVMLPCADGPIQFQFKLSSNTIFYVEAWPHSCGQRPRQRRIGAWQWQWTLVATSILATNNEKKFSIWSISLPPFPSPLLHLFLVVGLCKLQLRVAVRPRGWDGMRDGGLGVSWNTREHITKHAKSHTQLTESKY